jgi:hypothetical protein
MYNTSDTNSEQVGSFDDAIRTCEAESVGSRFFNGAFKLAAERATTDDDWKRLLRLVQTKAERTARASEQDRKGTETVTASRDSFFQKLINPFKLFRPRSS